MSDPHVLCTDDGAARRREVKDYRHRLGAGACCYERALCCVHMSNLDHELALFSDEIVVRARETEAEAMAAQTARFEQAQHAMAVRCHPLPCWAFRIRV